MAHGASTTDDCPLEGCGGTVVGYWSEHEREDGTCCEFGPDHPEWEAWDEARTVCGDCGEGDRPDDPLEMDSDQGIWWHQGCRDDCELCGVLLNDGDGWTTYGVGPGSVTAHSSCFNSDDVESDDIGANSG
jgi:hypothetical protein